MTDTDEPRGIQLGADGPTSDDAASETRIDRLKRRLRRAVELLRGSTVPGEPYAPGRHGEIVSFDGLDGYEEIDRYWVNAPFAFVSINYDPEESEHLYYVVEPELAADEYELLELLFEDIRDPLVYRPDIADEDVESVLREELREHLERYGAEVDGATVHRLFYYLFRAFRGYGKIDPIINDPHVEDISCDGYELPIFVYHDEYTDVKTNVSFEREALDNFVVRLA